MLWCTVRKTSKYKQQFSGLCIYLKWNFPLFVTKGSALGFPGRWALPQFYLFAGVFPRQSVRHKQHFVRFSVACIYLPKPRVWRKDGQERGRVAGSFNTHLIASISVFFTPTTVKFMDVACMLPCFMEALSMNSGSSTGTPNFRSPKM